MTMDIKYHWDRQMEGIAYGGDKYIDTEEAA